ncbi:ash family protein [Providencia manganoxydans]|uniref:ash family protein n=1 Tax=Providencia manganoxydans TaxID=2923283 RepID=UPI0034E4E534
MHGHIQIMVGRAGELKGSPGFIVTGSSNPVRLTTILEIGTSGGDSPNLLEIPQ